MSSLRYVVMIAGTTALLVGLTPQAHSQEGNTALSSAQVQSEMAARRAARRAQADQISVVSPFYSIAHGEASELYLMNTIAEPLLVSVGAVSRSGERLHLGRFEVGVSRHHALSLNDLLLGQSEEFTEGSLEVSYLGQPDDLQAWLILKRGLHRTALPLTSSQEAPSHAFLSFWGNIEGGRSFPRFFLTNTGTDTVRYRGTLYGQQQRGDVSGHLAAGETAALLLNGPALPRPGWIQLEHDGEPGTVIGLGILEGKGVMGRLPWVDSDRLPTDTIYHTTPLPYSGFNQQPATDRPSKASISLFNLQAEAQAIQLEVIDTTSGVVAFSRLIHMGPLDVKDVDLSGDLTSARIRGAGQGIRLTFRGEQPFLVSGRVLHSTGESVDLAIFGASSVHGGGSYPIPSVQDHQVVTSVVNLGERPLRIIGQVYWDGDGETTYAIGPLSLPAGASLNIDLDALIAAQAPDILGRLPAPQLPGGFIKWSSLEKGGDLIGRTDARVRNGKDQFGFSCFGCCEEFPTGVIVPGAISFVLGEAKSFDACVQYSTCNGTMGPYSTDPTSLISPSSFSWDGHTISASIADSGTLTFQGEESRVRFDCSVTTQQVGASGQADACKGYLRKSHNPTGFWNASQAACTQEVGDVPPASRCSSCNECCDDKRNYWICKKKNRSLVDADHRSCQGACLIDQC